MLPFASRVLNATDFEYGLIEGVALVGFLFHVKPSVGRVTVCSEADPGVYADCPMPTAD